MTALTDNRDTARRDGRFLIAPVGASQKIYAGALVEVDSSGNVGPAKKGSGKTYLGVAQEPADNTGGSAGALVVTIHRGTAFHFAKSGTAVRGKDAYALDDQTVTDVSTGASKVGRILDTDDDGVWVLVD